MKIIEMGYDPYKKGIYMCDCDCKGHGQMTILENLEKQQKEIKENLKKSAKA